MLPTAPQDVMVLFRLVPGAVCEARQLSPRVCSRAWLRWDFVTGGRNKHFPGTLSKAALHCGVWRKVAVTKGPWLVSPV